MQVIIRPLESSRRDGQRAQTSSLEISIAASESNRDAAYEVLGSRRQLGDKRSTVGLRKSTNISYESFNALFWVSPLARIGETAKASDKRSGEGEEQPSPLTETPQLGRQLPHPEIIRKRELWEPGSAAMQAGSTLGTYRHFLRRVCHLLAMLISHETKAFLVQQPQSLPRPWFANCRGPQLLQWDAPLFQGIGTVLCEAPALAIAIGRE